MVSSPRDVSSIDRRRYRASSLASVLPRGHLPPVTDLFSSFAAALHRIQKCPQTDLKTVRHCRHSSSAEGLLELGKGPRRELRPGERQIDFRVPGRFAKGISEDEVIDDCKQSKLFSRGHG